MKTNYIIAYMDSITEYPTGLYMGPVGELSEDDCFLWLDKVVKELHPIEDAVAIVETPLSREEYWEQEEGILAGLIATLFDVDLKYLNNERSV